MISKVISHCSGSFSSVDGYHDVSGSARRISLDMINSVNRQIMPGSKEHKVSVFSRRNELASSGKGYILRQYRNIVWRLLHARLVHGGSVLPSYVIARSCSKMCVKSGNIVWIKQKLHLDDSKRMAYESDLSLLVGYCKRDDSVIIDIALFNFFLGTSFESVLQLLKRHVSYQEELRLRCAISGMESVNPIIVVDHKLHFDVLIHIESVMQEEDVFDVIEECDMITRP